jgi:uncharacterized membrane-anchored protein
LTGFWSAPPSVWLSWQTYIMSRPLGVSAQNSAQTYRCIIQKQMHFGGTSVPLHESKITFLTPLLYSLMRPKRQCSLYWA